MAMRRGVVALPLFWRVFAANASVLMLAFCGLVFAPVTVSVPVGAGELAILATGLVALLAANVVFLRPAFAPLEELAETMRHHDPLTPGVRADVTGDASVVALAQTFNDMLDRLETERRDSARQALTVQEAERARPAQRARRAVERVRAPRPRPRDPPVGTGRRRGAGGGARHLPRRAGGADERRPSC
jgi:two-component system, NarL family, sensor histidine kinase UhpB